MSRIPTQANGTLRRPRLLWATLVAGALVLAAAGPAGATAPADSGHVIYDVARVHLTAGGLDECDGSDAAGATIEFFFIAGDLLAIPIGQRPGEWTDADPFIQVFWCNDEYHSIATQSGGIGDEVPPEDRTIDLYDSAHLSFTRELLQDGEPSGVTMSVDLDWEAIGDPVTNVWEDGGRHVMERVAQASVTGTVIITGWVGPWGDTLTFTADNTSEDGTNLAHVNEVWMPESGGNSPVSGTTTIAQADAWFTSPVAGSETCDSDNLYVNLGEDAFRGTGNAGKPPTLSGWLDVQTWHESGCDPEPREQSNFVQQTWWGLDPSQYDMDSLYSAWVDFEFPIYDGEAVDRTVTFNLVWAAEGDPVVVKGRDGSMVVNGWERTAQLSGTVTDSWGLIGIDDLDRANMSTAHYLMK